MTVIKLRKKNGIVNRSSTEPSLAEKILSHKTQKRHEKQLRRIARQKNRKLFNPVLKGGETT